jgi:hypothetical protein
MIVSKDPTIASGATPIGNAGRAPDKKEEDKRSQIVFCRSRQRKIRKEDNTSEPILEKIRL